MPSGFLRARVGATGSKAKCLELNGPRPGGSVIATRGKPVPGRRVTIGCGDTVRWLYRLDEDFAWPSPFPVSHDVAFQDAEGQTRLLITTDGTITVLKGYAWDGCTPKVCFLDLLVGTPDGAVYEGTGRPKTYYASLVHDVAALPSPARSWFSSCGSSRAARTSGDHSSSGWVSFSRRASTRCGGSPDRRSFQSGR